MYHALVDTCDHCVNETQNWETKDSELILFWRPRHLTRRNQGGREPWEQGWARTFLNNEGVSSFAEMADYNVEAKWTMAEWNSQNTLSLLYKGFQVAKINFWLYENARREKSAKE